MHAHDYIVADMRMGLWIKYIIIYSNSFSKNSRLASQHGFTPLDRTLQLRERQRCPVPGQRHQGQLGQPTTQCRASQYHQYATGMDWVYCRVSLQAIPITTISVSATPPPMCHTEPIPPTSGWHSRCCLRPPTPSAQERRFPDSSHPHSP